ncbi:MAG: hypothetical protein ABIK20_02985 [Candidatus Omnitrophota bacterium]
MRKTVVAFQTAILLLFWTAVSHGHLCDNVFRQADKLIVKPETYNIVVKDQATFKIFLQNNMDRQIAEISLLAESPAFNFIVTPAKMSIPKDQRTYFTVTMTPRAGVKTGNYPINFRLVGGGKTFKEESFSLKMEEGTSQPKPEKTTTEEVKKESGTRQTREMEIKEMLQVKPSDQPPKLDGIIDDKCWKSAGVASNFSLFGGGVPALQTVALLAFDREYLHFGIYCNDDETNRLTKDDKLEIEIGPNRYGYPWYYLSISRNNAAKFQKVFSDKTAPWNASGINYRLGRDKESWTLELSVPFSALGRQAPTAKEIWRLRIIRSKANGSAEKSFWADTAAGYNRETGFGEFALVP